MADEVLTQDNDTDTDTGAVAEARDPRLVAIDEDIAAATKRLADATATEETPAVDEVLAPAETVIDTTPYALALPGMLSDEEADEHAPVLDSFALAAHAAGLDQPVAQQLATVYESVSRALLPVLSRVNTETGETEYSDLADRDEMTRVSLAALGADAPAIHSAAAKYVKAHPALAQWLDDSFVGNSPAALVALALASEGVFALSPAAAAVELGKLTADRRGAFYHAGPGHVVAVARASVLQSIISEGAAFDAEVDALLASERSAEQAAREAAEQAALDRKLAQEQADEMARTVAESKLRGERAAKLKADALAKSRADAADAAAERKSRAWATLQAPSATAASEIPAARAELSALIASGACDGSSPSAQVAKARFQKLLALVSA